MTRIMGRDSGALKEDMKKYLAAEQAPDGKPFLREGESLEMGWQRFLQAQGFYQGQAIDGKIGPKSVAATREYLETQGYDATGNLHGSMRKFTHGLAPYHEQAPEVHPDDLAPAAKKPAAPALPVPKKAHHGPKAAGTVPPPAGTPYADKQFGDRFHLGTPDGRPPVWSPDAHGAPATPAETPATSAETPQTPATPKAPDKMNPSPMSPPPKGAPWARGQTQPSGGGTGQPQTYAAHKPTTPSM
jgi:hypothetical protein